MLYFPPVVATLSTKYFWQAKKRMTHGIMHTTLAAIRRWTSLSPYCPRKAFSASVSVRLDGELR